MEFCIKSVREGGHTAAIDLQVLVKIVARG